MSIYPVIIIILFICSGIFSGSEIAFVALSPANVRALKKTKHKNAGFVEKLKASPQHFLITVLIGNNLVNIAASVLATVWVTEAFGSQWLGAATGALTLLVLIFGEIIPKNFAQLHAKSFALAVAPWIYLLQKSLFPIVWTLNKLSKYAVILLGGGRTAIPAVTEEELIAMVSISAEAGAIEKREKEMIKAVLDLDDIRVDSIMNPRSDIVGISENNTLDEAIKLFTDAYRSRILVFGEDAHEVIGVLHIRDSLKYKQQHSGNTFLKDLRLTKPVFVPKTRRINVLFKELQKKRRHLAVVVDEHGTVIGLVTLEDILEEVFGEIKDEHEEPENEITIHKTDENNWHISGDLTVKALRRELGEILPEFKGSRTVAYVLLVHFQKIPQPGDSIELDEYRFVVEKMDKNRIEQVKIRKIDSSG